MDYITLNSVEAQTMATKKDLEKRMVKIETRKGIGKKGPVVITYEAGKPKRVLTRKELKKVSAVFYIPENNRDNIQQD